MRTSLPAGMFIAIFLLLALCCMPRAAAVHADDPRPPATVSKEQDLLEAPLKGLRGMLQAMDALIAAFQEDSEIFTKLVEVYQAGGPLWARLEQCIEETHRELREGPSI